MSIFWRAKEPNVATVNMSVNLGQCRQTSRPLSHGLFGDYPWFHRKWRSPLPLINKLPCCKHVAGEMNAGFWWPIQRDFTCIKHDKYVTRCQITWHENTFRTLIEGFHCLLVDSRYKEPIMGNFDVIFVGSLNNCWKSSRVTDDFFMPWHSPFRYLHWMLHILHHWLTNCNRR